MPLALLVLALVALLWSAPAAVAAWTTRDERGQFVVSMIPLLESLGLTPAGARLAVAHAGVETSFGTAGTSQPAETFNYWNVTAGSSWRGATLAGGDRDGAGNAITQSWRVYSSAAEAARDYLALLALPRYAAARAALDAGDATAFARELRAGGYYEASEAKYLALLVAAQAQMAFLTP